MNDESALETALLVSRTYTIVVVLAYALLEQGYSQHYRRYQTQSIVWLTTDDVQVDDQKVVSCVCPHGFLSSHPRSHSPSIT